MLSLLSSSTDIVMVVFILPSIILSSTPVTVTVCALFQFAFVNVKLDADTVASPVSPDVTLITTSLSGCAPNTTVKVAVLPPSVTVPEIAPNVKAAVSLSVVVTVTV